MTNYREILRLAEMGFSNTKIAEVSGVSRQTAATILRRAKEAGVTYDSVHGLSDRELAQKLNPQSTKTSLSYKMPDYAEVHKELQKPGVTIMLLWQEYCEKCRQYGELPYQETQFHKYYHDYAAQTKATLHLNRKPGELMEVDWAGTTVRISDNITGEAINAYVFVAVLAHSNYGYAEAFWDMTQGFWITGHINAYEYFGGVTRILVPDNLKTGVIKHTKNEIVLKKRIRKRVIVTFH